MAPTKPSTRPSKASTAGLSFASRHGVQPMSANEALDTLKIAQSGIQASLKQGHTYLNGLLKLRDDIRNLEANHAQVMKDKDAYIIDLQKSNTELESEKEALKGQQKRNKRNLIVSEQDISGLKKDQTWLRVRVADLERQLKTEKAKKSADESAKDQLKRIKDQLTMIAGQVRE